MNLNFVSIMAIICVCVEIWHIVSYNFLYKKIVFRVQKISNWAKQYTSFIDAFTNFCESVVEEQELKDTVGINDVQCLLEGIRFARRSVNSNTKHNILKLCTFTELKITIAWEIFEFLYWIAIVILCCQLPFDAGIPIIIIAIIFSKIQSYMQKSKSVSEKAKKSFYMLDCCTFIAMFTAVIVGTIK